MSKLFLATSFSQQVDPTTGQVKPELRKHLEALLTALRAEGFTVFCAAEHEGWVIANDPPAKGVAHDLAEIDQADAMLAVLMDKPSTGVQFELGYAHGQGKKVFVATAAGTPLAYFNQGLAELGHVTHLIYDEPHLLAKQIRGLL